jgi:excisionase family DNA binding protein
MPDETTAIAQERFGGVTLPSEVLEAFARALASGIAAEALTDRTTHVASDFQLLDVDETAELLGVSRTTVTRLADEGVLPSVVVRRGKVQKIRRIPRAFVERMVLDANAGAHVDMEDYAAAWLAGQARTETGD